VRAPSRRGRTWISANLTVEQVGLHFIKESLYSVQYIAYGQFAVCGSRAEHVISKVSGTYSIISTALKINKIKSLHI
jgi:hypothetical protein